MSLEIMQMKLNNIADKLEELSDTYTNRRLHLDRWQDEFKHDMIVEFEELTFNIARLIREEMKITHY